MYKEFLKNDGFVLVSNILIKKLNNSMAALYLGELLAIESHLNSKNEVDDNGYFQYSLNRLIKKFRLGKHLHNKIVNLLKNLDILKTTRKGLPARTYIRISGGKLYDLIHDIAVGPKSVQLDGPKSVQHNYNNNYTFLNYKKVNNSELKKQQPNSLSKMKRDLKKKSTLTKQIILPKKIKLALRIWNNSGLRKHTKPDSRIYKDSIIKLKKLFQKHTIEQWKCSVMNFALGLKEEYLPVDKSCIKKTSLPGFIENPHLPKSNEFRHRFKFFLDKTQTLVEDVKLRNNAYPEITKMIKLAFDNWHNLEHKVLTTEQENSFRVASFLLHKFRKKVDMPIDLLADTFIDSLAKRNNGDLDFDMITSKYAFNKILTKRLLQLGYEIAN